MARWRHGSNPAGPMSTTRPRTTIGPVRRLGFAVNMALRMAIVAILADARARPDDARYRGKGIGNRALVMLPLSLVVPLWQRGPRAKPHYPVWVDNLWLSIFALDLVGNYLDLYDSYRYFDAIPHSHGTGAATVVAGELLDMPALSAIGLTQLAHVGLEAQEYYSDVAFGLRNVRGTWDVVNDLLAGAVGATLYGWLLARSRASAARRPE